MDIADWLRDLGLGRYEQAFRDNEIDAEVLVSLTVEDLKEIGVVAVGHRRKLLDAIAALRAGAAPSEEPAGRPAPVTFAQTGHVGPEALQADRRQLTVLFCDLVGSTALSARLDPEDLREVIGTYHRLAAEVVTAAGGFVAKYMGDGMLAYFGYPQAREDDAERAVRAGLELVAAVRGTRPRPDVELGVRVGIATGLAVVGDLIGAGSSQEHAIVGETPNLAARLQNLAAPNSVIIAHSTRRLLGDLFECRDLGALELKGLAAPATSFEVLRGRVTESRFAALHASRLAPVIGREEQIELLMRRWQQAKRGEGRVVLLTGEAGIGKSRIIASLQDQLRAEAPTRLSFQCPAHIQNSPLHPFIAELERSAGFDRDDTEPSKLAKARAHLAATAASPEDAILLTALLSLGGTSSQELRHVSPQRWREMTFGALLRRLERLSLSSPVLMIFEDVHWIDPTSRELLAIMVDRLPSMSVLLVASCRPEIALPWAGESHVTVLALNHLSRPQALKIIGYLTQGKELPGRVLDEIILHADGVPLFVEELTKTVLESDFLRIRDDRYVLDGPLPPLAIPTTLQAALLARLDRVPAVKEVAQIGAALGREFSYELIQAVAPLSAAALDSALERFVASGLVFAKGTPPRSSYVFKHALVQDAAYETVLKGRRQQLHARIAEVLERLHPEMAAQQPELLARHWTKAGASARAADLWTAAARSAHARGANREALEFLEHALADLRGLEETPVVLTRVVDLRRALFTTLYLVGDLHRIGANLEEAERLATRLNDMNRLGRILADMTYFLGSTGEIDAAIAAGERALAIAMRTDDLDARAESGLMLARALCAKGHYRAAIDQIGLVIAMFGDDVPLGQHGIGMNQSVAARVWLTLCHAELGDFAAGAASSAEAMRLLARMEREGEHEDLIWWRNGAGRLAVLQENFAKAVEVLEPALASCEREFVIYFSRIAASLGTAYVRLGEVERGLALLRQAVSRAEAIGFLWCFGLVLAQYGEALLLAGDSDGAREVGMRALTVSRNAGEEASVAWALRLLGDVAARLYRPEAAEHYRDALEIAERLGMAPLQARCLEGRIRLG